MSAIQAPGANTRKIGRTIFGQALSALMKNKNVLLVPVLTFLINAVLVTAFCVAAIAVYFATGTSSSDKTTTYVVTGLMYVALSIVHVFSQAILMSAANDIYDGKPANLTNATAAAFAKAKNLLVLGLMEATVGLILRVIAERLNNLGGALLRFIGGLAWGVATYFAIPEVLFKGASPLDSIKNSIGTIKAKWGNVLRANVVTGGVLVALFFAGFGFLAGSMLLLIAGADSGTGAWWVGSAATAAVGILLILAYMVLQSTVLAFVKVAVYRFASEQGTGEVDANLLQSAFKLRR
jgi:hypothetical protein